MKVSYLREHLSFDQSGIVMESDDKDGKSLYLKGIAIQGGIRNANQRVYPVDEIERAVKALNDQIQNGYSVLGEVDHPDDLVRTMLESGVKLGVSSRGSGNVSDMNGHVSDFEIITVDVVAQPSAPGAYPTPVYEHLMNARGGNRAFAVAQEVKEDPKAQKYLKESLLQIIKGLK